VTPRVSLRVLTRVAAVLILGSGSARAVTEPPPEPQHLGLYEWMATAPFVIAAEIVADDGRFVRVVSRSAIKGELTVNAVALVDQRQANRDRDVGTPALDLTKGKSYLLLLTASPRGKKEPFPVFDLVRGVRGARPLPVEGSAATIDAASRLAALQQRNNDDVLWATLPDFLEDQNPLLIDAALDLYVKFHRESVALIPVLSPLLQSPRPDVRRRAALVLGRVLQRTGATDAPDRPEAIAELTGRARRDDDVGVRREATLALASLPDAGINETLRAIARDDPDQDVRFEAEKSVFARSQGTAGKRSD
jgi:hypothetical protein